MFINSFGAVGECLFQLDIAANPADRFYFDIIINGGGLDGIARAWPEPHPCRLADRWCDLWGSVYQNPSWMGAFNHWRRAGGTDACVIACHPTNRRIQLCFDSKRGRIGHFYKFCSRLLVGGDRRKPVLINLMEWDASLSSDSLSDS